MTTDNNKDGMEEIDNLERITHRGLWWVRLDRIREIVLAYADQRVREERERIIKCLPETSLINAYPNKQKVADIEKAIIHQIKSIITNPPRQ